MLHPAGHCTKDECTRYSDVDVYYKSGPPTAMCAEHAWDEEGTVQLVPQHGSDNINIERESVDTSSVE